ncbi:MAG: malonyl-CoA decarboxylase family protein [Desulfobulbaceae bacterium]
MHHITTHWPDAIISAYDPTEAGHLPDEFSGAGNDLILLGSSHGERDGVDVLRRFVKRENIPPVIYFGTEEDEDEARKLGPDAHFIRDQINHDSLIVGLSDALILRQHSVSTSAPYADDMRTGIQPPIKGYRFIQKLSSTEHSGVYLAERESTHSQVVLKVLRQMPGHDASIGAFDRFLHEYETIAAMDHPNIVGIYDLGVADDHAHIAMEYLSGGDLRSRLDSNRLCFAFFHNKMPAEPLIFVEVALGNKLSANIQDLLNKEDDTIDPEHATTAIFYSISNTQPGLAGINLGNFLIKTVVQELSNQFDNLTHFATLSPLPGLKKWLGPRLADGNEEVLRPKEIVTLKERFACENAVLYLSEILTNDWYRDSNTSEIIKPILTRLCAQYLLAERRGNKTLDPVANFHLSNGARLERINWLADISETGMKLSYGIMVNYYYELADIEKNHEQYATKTHIVASRGVKALLK